MGWAVLALGIGVCASGCAQRQAIADAQVTGGPLRVSRGPFVRTMLLTGELVAEEGVSLITPNANIWPVQVRWLAEDGVEVRAGEPVVEFDNSQLTSNLEEFRAGVVEARNQLASSRAKAANDAAEAAYTLEEVMARLEKAELEANVPPELFAAREFEQRQLDFHKAQLELAESKQNLESVRGTGQAAIDIQAEAVASAERRVVRAESRIGLLSLVAPRDGIFLRRDNGREGRPFDAGDNAYPGRAVATMPELDTMMVEAMLYDVDDGRIAPGMAVRAVLDAHPEEVYAGRVRSIDQLAREAGPLSSRRTFRAVVTLDDLDLDHMRPGMSVRLEIDAGTQDDVLSAPRVALDWSSGGARAFRRDGPVAVELGACNTERCIVESGLAEGDELALASESAG